MIKSQLTSFGQWQLVKPLGSGAFGEVHFWKNRTSGHEIATKRLKDNPKLRPDEISILHKRWLQEYKWMQNLRTNFIVGAVKIDDISFLNYLNEQNNTEIFLPVIIMEYCNGGDLRAHLNKMINLNGLKEFEVRSILYALLRATEYLHQECNIEHRDIKPENVVLHIRGNEKIYKLTDFGYAREIPECTIAQSVVGTRNYVAPEVIDPGIYTKSVDYWSIGVLAYEIICGIHPFIPHQTFVNRMKNIQRKPSECIAIVQNVDDLNIENFEFINKILHQNHLSCIYLHKIEKWLRLALDTNYKTRGFNANNQLKFYSDLDACLREKVVTVFSLKTLKIYYYNIESYKNLQNFYNKICADNQIDITNIFFIFPPLHPKKSVQHPVDYFVTEWYDTSNPDNPPVMLFVTEFLIQTNCDIDLETFFVITDVIKKCMSISAEKDNMENVNWLLHQFERDVHFILNQCQHLLECYIMGLHYFAIEIDHVVCTYNELEILVQKTFQLSGSVNHSHVVLDECIKPKQDGKLAKRTAAIFNAKCQELKRVVVPQLKATHKEILAKCRDLAKNTIYETYTKSDLFQLFKYRKWLSVTHSPAERLENTQLVFDKCIQNFVKFTRECKNLRECMNEQIRKFNHLRQRVHDVNNIILRMENELEKFTRSLIQNIINEKLSVSMSSLQLNGSLLKSIPFDNQCSLSDFDMDSKVLIDECQTLCSAMELSLDMN